MQRLMRSVALLAAPILLSVALAGAPASATPTGTNPPTAQDSVVAGWQVWDRYTSLSQCETIGAFGQLGGAWSAFTCSYVPPDAEPYWLWVFI